MPYSFWAMPMLTSPPSGGNRSPATSTRIYRLRWRIPSGSSWPHPFFSARILKRPLKTRGACMLHAQADHCPGWVQRGSFFQQGLSHHQAAWGAVHSPAAAEEEGAIALTRRKTVTQHRRPPQLTFTKEEEECMQAEIQGMLEKRPSPGEEKTPQNYKPQEAKPVSEDRALQDGCLMLNMLKDLLRAGDWTAKIDLKDAYFMIPIAKEDREFLMFKWKMTHQFPRLLFGLSSAQWVFTKTTRPVVAIMREVGLCLIITLSWWRLSFSCTSMSQ